MILRIILYLITIPIISWSGHLIKAKASLATVKAFGVFSGLVFLIVLWFVIIELISWLHAPKRKSKKKKDSAKQ